MDHVYFIYKLKICPNNYSGKEEVDEVLCGCVTSCQLHTGHNITSFIDQSQFLVTAISAV